MASFFKSSKKKNAAAANKARELRQKHRSLPGGGRGFADLSSYDPDTQKSDLDKALQEHLLEAEIMAEKIKARAHRTDGEHHPTAELEEMLMETYGMNGCYFIGHTNTDMDSIASAIGGASLFNGVATRSEREVNGEIEFACDYAGVDLPPYFDDVKGSSDVCNEKGIVLVDHNEPGQMIASLGKTAFPGKDASKSDKENAMKQIARVKGIIDHHALSEGFATGHPLFVDIRPWGSACSIITHLYVRLGRPIPKTVCLVLLCGILSDTINLTSPTTTHADKVMATLLAFLAEERHPNQLAKEMFKAKTAHLTKLPPYSIVRADQKNFKMGEFMVGWATIEVNDPLPILQKSRQLLMELRVLKKEKELDFAFLSVVDIDKKNTKLLLCGENESTIAKEAFGGKFEDSSAYAGPEDDHSHDGQNCRGHSHSKGNTEKELNELTSLLHIESARAMMDIGAKISRKKEFVPPLKTLLSAGWKPSRQSVKITKAELAPSVHTEHACVEGVGCSIQRTYSLDQANQQDGN